MLGEACRKYDDEVKWKDSLDSKALSLLGFNAVFVALLATASSFSGIDAQDATSYLWLPVLIQVVSTLLLLRVISVGPLDLGPSIVDVFKERDNWGKDIVEEVTAHYVGSTLANRIVYSGRAFYFQLAVIMTATSVIQLTIGLLAFLDSSSVGGGAMANLIKWVPGLVILAVSGVWTVVSHYRAHVQLETELVSWEFYIKSDGGRTDGNKEENGQNPA